MRGSLGIYLGRSAAVFGHKVFAPTRNGTVDTGYFLCTRHVKFNKVPKLYFAYPHDEQHQNTLFTLFDNPLYIGFEQNRERDVNLNEYLFQTIESKRNTQIADGDSDLMDVDISSDSDVSMDDYHDESETDDEDLDDENFQISTSTLHDDVDMELPIINERELLEDTNYLLTDMLSDKMKNNEMEPIQMLQQGLNGTGRKTRSTTRAMLGPPEHTQSEPYATTARDQDQQKGLFQRELYLDQHQQEPLSNRMDEHLDNSLPEDNQIELPDPVGVPPSITGSSKSTSQTIQNESITVSKRLPEANATDHNCVDSTESENIPTTTKLNQSQPSSELIPTRDQTPVNDATTSPSLPPSSSESSKPATENTTTTREPRGKIPKLPSKSLKTKRIKPVTKPLRKDTSRHKSSGNKRHNTHRKIQRPERDPLLEEVMQVSEAPSNPENADEAPNSQSHWDTDNTILAKLSPLSPQNSRKTTDSNAQEDNSNVTTQATPSRFQDQTLVTGRDNPTNYEHTGKSTETQRVQPNLVHREVDSPGTTAPIDIINDQTAVARRTRSKQPRALILDDRVLGKIASSKVQKPTKRKANSAKELSMANPRKVDKLLKNQHDRPTETPTVIDLQNVEQPATAPEPVHKTKASKLQSIFESDPIVEDPTPVGDDVDLSTEQREGISTKDRRTSNRLKEKQKKLEARPTLRRSLPRAAKASKDIIKKVTFAVVNNIDVQVSAQPKSPFPKHYHSAMNAVDRVYWKEATDAEFASHAEQVTWNPKPIIVDKDSPLLKKTIMTKWVFTIKSDGTYKARLVARGDLQDDSTYDATYSPTLRPEIARSIFAQNVTRSWYFKQFDFKTAYLNSLLNTDIYIYAPAGYSKHKSKSDPNKRVIYKLNRGLYGLKQAGRLWHIELSKTLKKIGYEKHDAFPSTFVKKNMKGAVISVIGLFVDDMIVSTMYEDEMQKMSDFLSEHYKLKEIQADENGMQRFLGMNLKVTRHKYGRTKSININQSEYIQSILIEYGVPRRPRIKTPLPPGFYFDASLPESQLKSSDSALKIAKHEYRKKIGLLLYLSVMTRPDITYAVNYLAQFCEYPHPMLFTIIERLFEYLGNTANLSLHYKNRKSEPMEIFTDSDYAQEPTTRHSMNGYLIRLNGNIVHWKSKYTALMCTSSTEAELQAIFIASNEGIWFRQLCVFIGLLRKEDGCKYRVDNRSIVDAINNDNFSATSKHYAVRLATVKERLMKPDSDDPFSEKQIRFALNHISGEDPLADILTKPITVKVIEKLIPLIMDIPKE